jgi:bla regulator protein BlaR1
MIRKILLFGLLTISTLIYSQENIEFLELRLDSIFDGNKGTFVLYDLQDDNYEIYNPDRAKQKFAVHSTSKIFWSIIGLEENLIANDTDIVKWDSIKYPEKEFWPIGFAQDQTIVSALRYSVNWYYFELLNLMTPEIIEKYLNNLDYQRGFDVERIHYFGLTFNIRKSAFEQIEFLKGLYENKYDLSERTLNVIKKGMTFEKRDDYTLYAKTGTGPIHNDNGLGWLIGYIEKDSKTYFFAFNVENPDELLAGKLRTDYSKRVLKALDLIE